MESAISTVQSIMSFLTGDSFFSSLLFIAIVMMVIGAVLGLFFKRGG